MQTARNLFIKKNVVLRVHDEGVEPDGNSPINRAPSSVSKIAQVLGTFVSPVLHNLAILEHQTNVGKIIALVTNWVCCIASPVD